MFINLPDTESAIDKAIAASQFNEALANIVVGVHNHYRLPEVAHKYLYYPRLDEQIQQLSEALFAGDEPAAGPAGDNTLIIATEMYKVGGHSRVIVDIAREVRSPTVVLTDLFWTYRKAPDQIDWLFDTLDCASILVLPQLSLWAKCRALRLLTRRLHPRTILYFNHHHDPIPFVGSLGHIGSRKALVHHCDHNPSLGPTLAGIDHVDVTEELGRICAQALSRDTQVLPLYVPDEGRKTFAAADNDGFSVVTSGTPNKYLRSGEIALQNIAQAVLTSTRGKFFHIGPIDAAWLAEIKAHLERQAIDSARFVALGPVASLWKTLAALDAHVYLGSAPVGGARAAIEVQGCGYPLVYFRPADSGSLVALESLYASNQLGWSTLPELSALLRAIGPELPSLGSKARSLYERRYSRDQFLRMLDDLGAA